MAGCQGEDWASYQDWSPATKGLAFVAIKVTESTSYTNPRYASQLTTARAAQLVTIHYHFARPGNMQTQADFFLRKATIKPGDVIALDWEDAGVSSADKDAWIRYVQSKMPHTQVILYCNRDFWFNRDHTGFAGDGLWIADPDAPMGQPRIKAPWLFHQYSSAGGLDRDYCPLTPAQLAEWAHAKETTDMPLTTDDVNKVAAAAAAKVWSAQFPSPTAAKGTDPNRAASDYLRWGDQHTADIIKAIRAQQVPALTPEQVTAIASQVAASPALAESVAEKVAEKLAARLQS